MRNLPQPFVEMLNTMPGHEHLAEALSTTSAPTSVRLNPHKPQVSFPYPATPVPWEPLGLYLSERPAFTLDPALYDGRYYVQDSSSMILGAVLRHILDEMGQRPVNYLDACAAPGGKTTTALSLLAPGSFLLANEYDTTRLGALVDNLARWGVPGYAVIQGDAARLGALRETFEIIAADVPCSGEGMMRRHQTAIDQWSQRLVDDCATGSRRIVEALWPALRPGGYLVYSTCTFNTTENEENVRHFVEHLGAVPVDTGLSRLPGILPGLDPDIPALRMLPGHVPGDGQFVAVLRKPGIASLDNARLSRPAGENRRRDSASPVLPPWVEGRYVAQTDASGNVYAVNRDHLSLVRQIARASRLMVPGLHVAFAKGRDLAPAHPLATSIALRDSAFPQVVVDRTTALRYLQGQALTLPSDTPRGYVLVRTPVLDNPSDTVAIGWVKNIGQRANNLFPSRQRIRTTID